MAEYAMAKNPVWTVTIQGEFATMLTTTLEHEPAPVPQPPKAMADGKWRLCGVVATERWGSVNERDHGNGVVTRDTGTLRNYTAFWQFERTGEGQ